VHISDHIHHVLKGTSIMKTLHRIGGVASSALLAAAVTATPASAATAPVLSCGTTVLTSCSQTATYTDTDQWETPLVPLPASCPAYLGSDLVHIVGNGRGVEHANLNKAGDFWATTTFTGEVTISAYAPGDVAAVFDDQGIVSATPTGPAEHIISGHLTEWFGVSDNKQNGVFSITTSVNGVDENGAPFVLHMVQHTTWTPGTEPFAGPPHTVVATGSC
jgi:hypothetical protein